MLHFAIGRSEHNILDWTANHESGNPRHAAPSFLQPGTIERIIYGHTYTHTHTLLLLLNTHTQKNAGRREEEMKMEGGREKGRERERTGRKRRHYVPIMLLSAVLKPVLCFEPLPTARVPTRLSPLTLITSRSARENT